MKVFWLNGGLHYEAETDDDRNALICLWNATRQEPDQTSNGPSSTGVITEQVFDRVVTR